MAQLAVSPAPAGGRCFPAGRAAAAVYRGGTEAVAVAAWQDTALQSRPFLGTGRGGDDSEDWSGTDDGEGPYRAAVDLHEAGKARQFENISQLNQMHTLVSQHRHNQNLVNQFNDLSLYFVAWRPVRGDGNCYYRAVLFAWLERSIALGASHNLRSYIAMLKPHRRVPALVASVRTCHRLLKGWIEKRTSCRTEADIRSLLVEVTSEFNDPRSDNAFVLCLRYLIADYLRAHAYDTSLGTDGGDELTYASWAVACAGVKNIDDYCQEHVLIMNKSAADLVQHACPRVLHTIVCICVVDRDTAHCHRVDYGDRQIKSASHESVKSAIDLTTTRSQTGSRPEIYLLLKPGHYDILIPRDDGVGRLLSSSGGVAGAAANPPGAIRGGPPWPIVHGQQAHGEVARHHDGQQWSEQWSGDLALLVGDVCRGFEAVLGCMEEKLVEELSAKRNRGGSFDESLFEGTLASVLEYALLERRPPQDVCCHLHDLPLGSIFMGQNLPGLAAPQEPEPETAQPVETSADRQPSALAARRPPSRQDVQANASSGLGTRRLLEAAAAARPASVEQALRLSAPSRASLQSEGALAQVPPSVRRIPVSVRHIPQSGNIGGAFGVPCVICFGEDHALKTLHCGYKAHVSCLHRFWFDRVTTLGRLTGIRCPAEVAGCAEDLSDCDLRGVIGAGDLAAAERCIRDVDLQNTQLIEELKRQSEEYRPMFRCAICLVDHEVEGCCTLPCQHRFCFESLAYHFEYVVRERRLSKLSCPAEGCGHSLRSADSIHIFQQCLPEGTYHKLLEFLTRDDPHIYACKWKGCEEQVFLDDGDDWSDLACPRGHRFCAKCDDGPHPGITCEARRAQQERERKDEEALEEQAEAWRSALDLGWKPCPRRCAYGGGYKSQEECDHVTCQCGFEFCWDCGVERQVPLLHDNRWHKPSCRYHTKPSEVAEKPKHVPDCPECQKMRFGYPCPFPEDDGYPHSYMMKG